MRLVLTLSADPQVALAAIRGHSLLFLGVQRVRIVLWERSLQFLVALIVRFVTTQVLTLTMLLEVFLFMALQDASLVSLDFIALIQGFVRAVPRAHTPPLMEAQRFRAFRVQVAFTRFQVLLRVHLGKERVQLERSLLAQVLAVAVRHQAIIPT